MEELYQVCRMCVLDLGTEGVNLMDKSNNSLRNNIEKLFNVKVTLTDRFTKKICSACIAKVKKHAFFYETVTANQERLTKWADEQFESLKIKEEIDDCIIIDSDPETEAEQPRPTVKKMVYPSLKRPLPGLVYLSENSNAKQTNKIQDQDRSRSQSRGHNENESKNHAQIAKKVIEEKLISQQPPLENIQETLPMKPCSVRLVRLNIDKYRESPKKRLKMATVPKSKPKEVSTAVKRRESTKMVNKIGLHLYEAKRRKTISIDRRSVKHLDNKSRSVDRDIRLIPDTIEKNKSKETTDDEQYEPDCIYINSTPELSPATTNTTRMEEYEKDKKETASEANTVEPKEDKQTIVVRRKFKKIRTASTSGDSRKSETPVDLVKETDVTPGLQSVTLPQQPYPIILTNPIDKNKINDEKNSKMSRKSSSLPAVNNSNNKLLHLEHNLIWEHSSHSNSKNPVYIVVKNNETTVNKKRYKNIPDDDKKQPSKDNVPLTCLVAILNAPTKTDNGKQTSRFIKKVPRNDNKVVFTASPISSANIQNPKSVPITTIPISSVTQSAIASKSVTNAVQTDTTVANITTIHTPLIQTSTSDTAIVQTTTAHQQPTNYSTSSITPLSVMENNASMVVPIIQSVTSLGYPNTVNNAIITDSLYANISNSDHIYAFNPLTPNPTYMTSNCTNVQQAFVQQAYNTYNLQQQQTYIPATIVGNLQVLNQQPQQIRASDTVIHTTVTCRAEPNTNNGCIIPRPLANKVPPPRRKSIVILTPDQVNNRNR